MKFPAKKYKIGDWVQVNKVLTVVSEGDARVAYTTTVSGAWESITETSFFVAQIVGIKVFYSGKIEYYAPECDPDTGYEYGGFNYLDVKDTIHAWAVKRGLMNKALYALDEDVCAAEPQELPVKWTNAIKWEDVDRKKQSEMMKLVPRDAKGRWTKQ